MESSTDTQILKVAVAMSGGVDSSVAAALSVEKYGASNVFGVTMKLFCYGEGEVSDKSCCSLDAINDAAAVCKQLRIRHYVVNLEKEFEQDVISDFVAGYGNGTTPNPCVRCNQLVKYERLLAKVKELGADLLVTGHYARITHDETGFHLLKGIDPLKDQSYFLYNLNQEQLKHVEFPVGGLPKTETRKLATKCGLKTAEKSESQDICFITDGVQAFLSDKIEQKPGNIVDSVGNILGRHNGFSNYTVGQRKGLGGGFSEVMYVIGIDPIKNEVIIGEEADLYRDSLNVIQPHWVVSEPDLPLECGAKIRYSAKDARCTVSRTETGVLVKFMDPQKAVTPGQSIVFYKGEEVLGGGVISLPVQS